MKIQCFTLFDITRTGLPLRRRPQGISREQLQQSNYDTVLQSISIRSQPEVIESPTKHLATFIDEHWGRLMFKPEYDIYYWKFTFQVQHHSVFLHDDDDLGALLDDCDGIPMIRNLDEWSELPEFLDTSPELCNIYFVKIED